MDGDLDDDEIIASEAEKRSTIAFFYRTECHCACEQDWSGRDGTIAHIRQRMGSSAPSVQMVRRTLYRLAGGDKDVSVTNRGGSAGPADRAL